MNILVSNDDGIFAAGLWTLARALKNTDEITIVAPDREQSATGTMVTLRVPLRVMKHDCFDPDIATYTVEGSPSDNVILALGKLATGSKLVISGINQGLNLGDDVLISGTVGAAMQGYLRGLPAVAISVPAESGSEVFETAARTAALFADKIKSGALGRGGFFNINVPNLPVRSIKGIKIAELAHKTHIETIEEGYDGRREYYWLVRRQLSQDAPANTDIWAVEHGYITITPLHSALFHRGNGELTASLCLDIFEHLKS